MVLQAHQFISTISGVAKNFKRGGHDFHFFLSVFSFARTKLKLIGKQKML